MPAPPVIIELIERLVAHKEGGQWRHYNEAQLREEFLNPFFEALGWDVSNRKGYSGSYKEVIHEDAIKIGGARKPRITAFGPAAGNGVSSSKPKSLRSISPRLPRLRSNFGVMRGRPSCR